MRHYLPLLLAVLALAPALLAGCDYPQAGFYSLVGRDAAGKAVLRLPFAVEELVDDTEMTTGFMLLLPAPPSGDVSQVVEVPVQNGTDFTARSWQCVLADADTNAGDVHVVLTHAAERLSFDGAYRTDAFSPISRLTAVLLPADKNLVSKLDFQTGLPHVPTADAVVSWELAAIEKKAFEQAIGGALAKAKRLGATAVDEAFLDAALLAEQVALEQTAQGADSARQDSASKAGKTAKRPKLKPGAKQNPPPNLGGRGGSRPR